MVGATLSGTAVTVSRARAPRRFVGNLGRQKARLYRGWLCTMLRDGGLTTRQTGEIIGVSEKEVRNLLRIARVDEDGGDDDGDA